VGTQKAGSAGNQNAISVIIFHSVFLGLNEMSFFGGSELPAVLRQKLIKGAIHAFVMVAPMSSLLAMALRVSTMHGIHSDSSTCSTTE